MTSGLKHEAQERPQNMEVTEHSRKRYNGKLLENELAIHTHTHTHTGRLEHMSIRETAGGLRK